jgi:hypothetical protein
MSQRVSGWERKPNELYETPAWVTEAALPHLHLRGKVWEPAYGGGWMSTVLRAAGHEVIETDKQQGEDFFGFTSAGEATAIVTNPPYNRAQEFIEHALMLMEPCQGVAAFLLRVDFDSAKTRQHLFAKHPAWHKKVVLLKRIVWFAGEKSPSFNHAWYIWDWRHPRDWPAQMAYAPLGD